MDDDNDIARYNRLIALGPAVHAVLGEELLRVDDFEPASRIIGIFEESRGDKSVAIKYLERFLDLPRTGSEWRDVKAQGSKAINKLRGEQSLLDAHGTVSHAAIPQDSAPTRKLELNPADANSPPTPMALPVSTKVPSETIAAVIEQTPYLWIWVGVTVALVVIVTIAIKRSA